MRVVIDRFEGGEAVCEAVDTRKVISLPIGRLPQNARAGSVLIIMEDAVTVDEAETALRTARAKQRLDSLWKE